ncbi:hypothetical protein EDC94DRAFT_608404 [Helicostylum pulchrum]|uniref:Uncharacterized protein n=1 Tax=Helicostylum pulchrum TaxID=562976 RepID=A0ABP9XY22_9FUNG|nr:hypothetical protein EDC94DRAFT_608404 [Helicostylum pulchrum]
MTSTTLKNKPLKWTTQRVNNIKSSSNRVNKRATPQQTRNNVTAAIMTAEIKTDPRKEIERLQNELEFTYDTVATITVHFESLHHAYTCSKPELDKSKNSTRLGEMEKELLTAYDDLGLQVTHLERKIAKLEKRLVQLRELESIYVAPPKVVVPKKKQPKAPIVNELPTPCVADESNFISSPCSSVDSSIADCQLEASNYYFNNDWNLSQIMNNNEQPLLFNDCSNTNMLSYPVLTTNPMFTTDYYQELCNLSTMDMYNSYIPYPQYSSIQ